MYPWILLLCGLAINVLGFFTFLNDELSAFVEKRVKDSFNAMICLLLVGWIMMIISAYIIGPWWFIALVVVGVPIFDIAFMFAWAIVCYLAGSERHDEADSHGQPIITG
jgi:hypothetical protein